MDRNKFKNLRRNTLNVKDLAKAAEKEKPKPRPSYLTWIKAGGWKSFGKAIVIIAFFGGALGALRQEINDRPGRRAKMEAEILMGQNVKGVDPWNKIERNRIKSEEEYQFGQSHIRENKEIK